MNGTERFKSLQQQARATRGEKDLLANELAEAKAKLEAGVAGAASSTAEANVSSADFANQTGTDFVAVGFSSGEGSTCRSSCCAGGREATTGSFVTG